MRAFEVRSVTNGNHLQECSTVYAKGQRKGTVKFAIKVPAKAKSVLVAGDFNGWKPVEMKPRKDGTYVADVSVPANICQYKFVVDGQWIPDPDHAEFAVNPFGSVNSVASVK
jgi:1,4-alpha-glucan branching enzyme